MFSGCTMLPDSKEIELYSCGQIAVSLQLFLALCILLRSLMSFVMTDEFSVMARKNNSRIGFSWTHSLPFCFWPIFNSMNIAMLTKGYTANKFESHNSLKLSFLNIRGLHWNFFECEYFLDSNFPDILALCEINLND